MTPTERPAAQDGLPKPQLYWAMLAIWLAISMAVLDNSIVNVALPSIARDLDVTAAGSVWIINAYQLAITVSLLPFAALGDRVGYRRLYMGGLVMFTLASLACALSQTLAQLTAARVLQGLGAAGVLSMNAALIRFTYPERSLGRGIGLNTLVISLAAALGPSIAAAILAAGSWQWLFAVNVPIGAVAVFLSWRALPRNRGAGGSFDWLSAVLNAAAFGFLILGAEALVRDGVGIGLVQIAIGAVAAVLLIRRELPRPQPLVPFDLLRIPMFSLSIATSIVSFAAQMLAFVVLPFYFQGALGRSAVETGLLMTAWPAGIGLAAPFAGRLADRYPAGLLGAAGLAALAVGLIALSRIGPHTGHLDIAWRMALCGFGFGFFQSPNARAILSAAPKPRSGAAGGMLATARLLGMTTGAVAAAAFFHLAGVTSSGWALLAAVAVAGGAALVSLSRLTLAKADPRAAADVPPSL